MSDAANKARPISLTMIGGTDGGGIVLVPDGHGGFTIKRIPGWNPEAILDLVNSISVIKAASRLKTPQLADAVFKSVGNYVNQQLNEHAGGANTVIVING